MSKTSTNAGHETFCSGDPLEYAIRGIDEISGNTKHSHDSLAGAIKQVYGTDVSTDTGDVLEQINNAIDPTSLISSVKTVGLDEEITGSENLGEAMNTLDYKISDSLCPRDKDASKITTKAEREHVYVPDVINNAGEDGTVYMAKTLSSAAKVRMAWDINDSNQVVVVDEYEKWERLLGWEKLKSFPHGKNKIREKLGDVLSDDVLEIVAGKSDGDSDTQANASSDTTSRGRRTRTKPSEEVLNLARSSRNKDRRKMKSKDIAETFKDDDTIGYNNINMLVLFPSTADRNMTDHWWVAGNRSDGTGSVAIANCNKGTFEYLNQYEEVWHIEDYLSQADDVEFETNVGPLTLNVASTDNLVIHMVTEKTQGRLLNDTVIQNMPETIVEYIDEEMYDNRAPEMPHPDDMVYAPITPEQAFWMRPELRKQQNPEQGDAVLLSGDHSPSNMGDKYNISSDYRIYSRARLPDWDFDEATELQRLDRANHYLKLDDGGYEVIETLAKLHDQGEQPFSQTPESRWSQ